jgi:ribokinase
MNYVAGVGFANCDILYSGMPRIPGEGQEVYSSGLDIKMGGGVPATMINLSRLGVPVQFSTFLGKDMFSRVVEEELERSGLDYVNLYKGDGIPVGVSCVIITNNDRTFVSYRDDFKITDDMLEKIYLQSAGAKIVEMHSSCLEIYKKLKKDHVTMILDTGWEDDLSIEKYSEYIELADYYTPSRGEAMKITGTSTPEDAIRVLGKYFRTPIVKLDKDGCMVMKDGKITVIPPMDGVDSVDPTGAGDAFMSGLIYGLFHDRSIYDSIRFGNITGGTCVAGIGCLTNFVNENELLSIADKYNIMRA